MKVRCLDCGKGFINVVSLSAHRKKAHEVVVVEHPVKGVVRCSFCGEDHEHLVNEFTAKCLSCRKSSTRRLR